MKVRILTITLLIAAILVQPATGNAQKRTTVKPRTKTDRWYVLVSPDGDFSLSFPQKPTREADEPGENSVFKSYGLYTHDGMRFSINFSELPMDPSLPSANQWTDAVEQGLLADDRENKRHVVKSTRGGLERIRLKRKSGMLAATPAKVGITYGRRYSDEAKCTHCCLAQ